MTNMICDLRGIVGRRHVLTSENATYRFRKGFRFGLGKAEAVVVPGSLIELWRVAQCCAKANYILIMQAANTGLTGGSSPDGEYDRPVVIVSTSRLKGIYLLGGDGRQVVCLPGASLYELEGILAPLGREPHSVIGSSCIGASVLGGISNNSGGSLVQRGPAFTEMALFGQVDAQGELHLVNHLGVKLKGAPEDILRAVEAGTFSPDDVEWSTGRGHDVDYVTRVRDVEADTPARFNADPDRLYEASGCAGKLIVFAVRLDTFPAEKEAVTFYIGTNDTDTLEDLRRALLTKFDELPIAGEYLHRDAFDIADRYGRDTVAIIRLMGTRYLPFFFAMKARMDVLSQRYSWLPDAFGDRMLQLMSRFMPSQVPQRLKEYHKRYEHHLMLKVSGTLAETVRPWLKSFMAQKDSSDFFECTAHEGKLAFLHRFATAGAAGRYNAVHRKQTGGMLALDVGLRRNDRQWFEKLPSAIDEKLVVKLYYGHFLCHVMHQDYVVKRGVNPVAVEHAMWPELDKRGARYPAEHNVGHLYNAPDSTKVHFQKLDPCNCLNPGIGRLTRRKNWVAESAFS
ncbi:D-lactate dehydrogenase [Saccharibacter sp. 17.LH.SD]|uniref:D-lactate dehydrogenase n=1 Tax=Saccharibacter sp. 17.LH.SD TaxID=2689393 RepID=UPI001370CE0F|nr:D-lactate dehydrogenase [Saccharibacter sp. 17.LH.SD]MXV45279.1 D-lactate dehydrogenase [Saccharibacter sp. 17.LH.SD]